MGAIIKVLFNAAALWVAIQVLDGLEFSGGWWALLGIALLLGVVNVIVKPILSILSLPLVILTLGLFLLVVNAITLAIVIAISDAMDLGLASAHFGWTFLAALIISLVNWGLEAVTGR